MSDPITKGPAPNVIDDPGRTAYMTKFALEYMQRHPDVSARYAKRQARQRWRNHQKKQEKSL